MPKILYIEDELTKNIATIKKFFAPILKDKRIKKELDELESSDRVFPDDIITACSYSSELEIAYTFPIALERILTNHMYYDLIIIDRNLSVYEYSEDLEYVRELLRGISLDLSDDRLLSYHEREGDLLLLALLKLDREAKDKVYYLTANTKDDLRGLNELQSLMDVVDFNKAHIIEKGSAAEATLSTILGNMDAFRTQNKFRAQCNILRNHLNEDDVNDFISMIGYYNKDQRKEFIFHTRKLLDNLLHAIAFNIGEPDADYWNPKNKKQLQVKSFIKGFRSGSTFVGLPAYDEKHHIGYNSIIRNACLSIFEICSDCGVHELSKAIDIESLGTASLSAYTMNTLLNQICDVICWYDKALTTIKSIH